MAITIFPPDWARPGAIGATTPNTVAATTVTGSDGTISAPSIAFTSALGTGLYYDSANTRLAFCSAVTRSFTFSRGAAGGAMSKVLLMGNTPVNGFGVQNDGTVYIGQAVTEGPGGGQGAIGFGSGSGSGVVDTLLGRDDAHIIALRNSTNPQGFRLYNTATSSTNHERLSIGFTSNVARIVTQKGSGGGTARPLELGTDDTTHLSFAATTGQATFSAGVATALVTLTDGATIATNLALSNSFEVTIAGNRTLSNPTNLINGGTVNWAVIASGADRTLTLDTAFVLPDGTSTPLTIASGKMLILSGVCRNNKIYVQSSSVFTP